MLLFLVMAHLFQRISREKEMPSEELQWEKQCKCSVLIGVLRPPPSLRRCMSRSPNPVLAVLQPPREHWILGFSRFLQYMLSEFWANFVILELTSAFASGAGPVLIKGGPGYRCPF